MFEWLLYIVFGKKSHIFKANPHDLDYLMKNKNSIHISGSYDINVRDQRQLFDDFKVKESYVVSFVNHDKRKNKSPPNTERKESHRDLAMVLLRAQQKPWGQQRSRKKWYYFVENSNAPNGAYFQEYSPVNQFLCEEMWGVLKVTHRDQRRTITTYKGDRNGAVITEKATLEMTIIENNQVYIYHKERDGTTHKVTYQEPDEENRLFEKYECYPEITPQTPGPGIGSPPILISSPIQPYEYHREMTSFALEQQPEYSSASDKSRIFETISPELVDSLMKYENSGKKAPWPRMQDLPPNEESKEHVLSVSREYEIVFEAPGVPTGFPRPNPTRMYNFLVYFLLLTLYTLCLYLFFLFVVFDICVTFEYLKMF